MNIFERPFVQQMESARREGAKVEYLLNSMGWKDMKWELIEWSNEQYDKKRLTFRAFHYAVTDFPIHLNFQLLYKLGDASSCSLQTLILKPEKSLIYNGWKKFHDNLSRDGLADGRPVGVVFPYGNIPGGLIVHDGCFIPRATLMRRRTVCFELKNRMFTVERYLHVLAAIKDSGWVSGKPLPLAEEKIVAPPILRRVKGVREKLVVLLFIRILNGEVEASPDWVKRVELIIRNEGERWIALSQQEIADALGLEMSQVRRALDRLRRDELVAVKPRGAENIYHLYESACDFDNN